ncbi:uncharacterized protein LOC6613641 [Drosophila sechellia]|uniref:GM17930 n=1 Tax=Drosophila sechellia TaxID=7238 RepID=B4I1X2_DROSE|nr:uncharacterized protein LOC6613641 [Drosophila sechellia]EDW54529.1 GM17930 [Drosophila sechellia]
MSTKKNFIPPNNSATTATARKIPEESLSITDQPGATSTPTHMTRKQPRLLSLQLDSALSLSLVDRVPQTFGDIRGRKGIRANSPRKTNLLRTRARYILNTTERVPPSIIHGRNSAKPQMSCGHMKTTEKTSAKIFEESTDTQNYTPKITPKMTQKTRMMQNVPAIKSPIKSTTSSSIIKPKTSAESKLKSPTKLSMMSTNSPNQSIKSKKNTPDAHFFGEVTKKQNATEEDISEPPSKQPRLHILQVNLGSPFAMTHSKKLKVIAVDFNDENQEAKEAPTDHLSQINTSEEITDS